MGKSPYLLFETGADSRLHAHGRARADADTGTASRWWAPGPFSYITVGGMFTTLKVREPLASYDDPGWYKHTQGTVASLASGEELRWDSIGTKRLSRIYFYIGV